MRGALMTLCMKCISTPEATSTSIVQYVLHSMAYCLDGVALTMGPWIDYSLFTASVEKHFSIVCVTNVLSSLQKKSLQRQLMSSLLSAAVLQLKGLLCLLHSVCAIELLKIAFKVQ